MRESNHSNSSNRLLPWVTLATLALGGCASANKNAVVEHVAEKQADPLVEAATKDDVATVVRLLIGKMGHYEKKGLQEDGTVIECSARSTYFMVARDLSDANSIKTLEKNSDLFEEAQPEVIRREAKRLQNGKFVHCTQTRLRNIRDKK